MDVIKISHLTKDYGDNDGLSLACPALTGVASFPIIENKTIGRSSYDLDLPSGARGCQGTACDLCAL